MKALIAACLLALVCVGCDKEIHEAKVQTSPSVYSV